MRGIVLQDDHRVRRKDSSTVFGFCLWQLFSFILLSQIWNIWHLIGLKWLYNVLREPHNKIHGQKSKPNKLPFPMIGTLFLDISCFCQSYNHSSNHPQTKTL